MSAKPGPEDDQHADETGCKAHPAAPADTLAEHRNRKSRDEQRRGEEQGDRRGQRHDGQGQVIGDVGAEHGDGPQRMQPRAVRLERGEARIEVHVDEHERQRHQPAHEDDLVDRQRQAQMLDDDVLDGEKAQAHAQTQDPAYSAASVGINFNRRVRRLCHDHLPTTISHRDADRRLCRDAKCAASCAPCLAWKRPPPRRKLTSAEWHIAQASRSA